jgi:hypothetical protein
MKKISLLHALLALMLLWSASAVAATINVTSDITANTTWTNDNVYVLFGDIFVKNNATLTIQPGTIIRGDKTTLSRLVVTTSGWIIAQGTPDQPIVFTSNQPAGTRKRADWAGVAILGTDTINTLSGGLPVQKRLECGNTADYDYGGSDAGDSSGVFSYVRIEYAGYVCGSNTELNSLTLGGVGSRTKIDHVMVSFGQDDGFELFGGSASGSHLISFGSRDDDFDTDDGWYGNIQYGLVVRVDTIADTDPINAFESDNDANGSANLPLTRGVFSNITIVGQYPTTSSTAAGTGWAARLRRNTAQSIFNSVWLGYYKGLRIENTSTQANYTNGLMEFKNNVIAGSKLAAWETSFDSAVLALPVNANTVYGGNANDFVQLVQPFNANPSLLDFRPTAGSPLNSGASFSSAKLSSFQSTNFRGAFGADNWASCWTEFTPDDENYTAGPINYAFTAQVNNVGSLTFCEGGSVQLNASSTNPSVTYLWNTGATTASIVADSSATYTVTVTTARGCTRTVSKTVTVNPLPAVPVITPSATSFCTGSNGVSLAASSGPNFSWSNGGNTATINVTFGGNYSVTVSDNNQCTASSTVISIEQNTPIAPVISATGSTTFCTGGTVDLVVNNPDNFSAFLWSDNSTQDTLTVTASGAYSVVTTDTNSCTATSNTITTSVSNAPTPTISANSAVAFCSGDSVEITATAADTYLWSNNATTQSIVVKASGTYSVTVTNADACDGVGASNNISVTVTPTPVATFTSAPAGSSYEIAFTNSSTNATSYLWNFGNGQTSILPAPTHTYASNGNFTVTLTATNGGCTDVSTGTVNIIGVGLKEVTSAVESIRLFPNPNNGVATLQIFSSNAEVVELSLTDLSGKVLLNNTLDLTSGTNQFNINTSDFGAGIYLMQIRNAAFHQSLRMVVNQ